MSAPATGFQRRGVTVKEKPFLSPGPRDTTVSAESGSRNSFTSFARCAVTGSAASSAVRRSEVSGRFWYACPGWFGRDARSGAAAAAKADAGILCPVARRRAGSGALRPEVPAAAAHSGERLRAARREVVFTLALRPCEPWNPLHTTSVRGRSGLPNGAGREGRFPGLASSPHELGLAARRVPLRAGRFLARDDLRAV